MKKLISFILSLIILSSSCFAGAFSAYAQSVEVSENCIKILLVGNSYTYYNGMDQMLCALGNATDKDLLVVSAVNGGSNAKELMQGSISYYAWYENTCIDKGTDTLENIAKTDFGDIERGEKWDYVVLQNNSVADITAIGDAYMLSMFSDMLESNKHFIINSNYWLTSLEKDRHNEHYLLANNARASLIDTRGIFTKYNTVFKNRIWFKDLTIRDSRNHPSVWGTYLFALSVYAKIFGVSEFPESPESDNMIEFYNSNTGNISEILNVNKFKNSLGFIPSLNKEDSAMLQYLVRLYAPYYIGGALIGGDASLPSSNCSESIVYYDEFNKPLNGWYTVEDYDYFFKNGQIVSDCMKSINSKHFYFDAYGERHTGWITYNGNKYWLTDDGSAATGFQNLICDNGKTATFCFTDKGVLITGLKNIGSKTYYFSTGNDSKQKGVMYKSCWHNYSSNGTTVRKYYNGSGEMVTGFNKINGKRYYFTKKGNLKKNTFIKLKSGTYYAAKNGVIKRNAIVKVKGKRYYLDKKGKMAVKRKFTFKKKVYKADKNGVIKKVSKKKAKKS